MLGLSRLPAVACDQRENQIRPASRALLHQAAALRRQGCASTSHVSASRRSGYRLQASQKGPEPVQEEEIDPLQALMQAAAEAGAKVEVDEDEDGLWDDDYLDVVAEGDDPWNRDAFEAAGHSHGDDGLQALAAAPAGPSAYAAEGGFRDVPAAELARLCSSPSPPLVIDLRSEDEFTEGRVPGSLCVPFEKLSDTVKAGTLNDAKGRPVALVCAAGSKAAQGSVRLQKVFGFADVVALRGGMLSYIAAGLPLEKGVAAPQK